MYEASVPYKPESNKDSWLQFYCPKLYIIQIFFSIGVTCHRPINIIQNMMVSCAESQKGVNTKNSSKYNINFHFITQMQFNIITCTGQPIRRTQKHPNKYFKSLERVLYPIKWVRSVLHISNTCYWLFFSLSYTGLYASLLLS